MKFKDMLAAAAKAPKPHKDIVVPLPVDGGEREQLEKDREALAERMREAAEKTDKRLSAPVPDDFIAEVEKLEERANALDLRDADHLITVRVWRIPGDEWMTLTAKHTNGFGGYDLNTVCREAAQINGAAVTDEGVEPISLEQWAELWGVLSGRSVDEISAAVYELNVGDTAREVERLGKVSRLTPAPASD